MIFLSKKWLITAYDNSLTEYHVYFGSFQRLRHALSCSKHLPYIWQTCRHYVRCTISVHEDTDAETVKWKCSKLKVKLISKNHEASKCASCEITESNPKKFMLAFIGYTIRITQIYSQTHTPTWLHIRTYKFTYLDFLTRLPSTKRISKQNFPQDSLKTLRRTIMTELTIKTTGFFCLRQMLIIIDNKTNRMFKYLPLDLSQTFLNSTQFSDT